MSAPRSSSSTSSARRLDGARRLGLALIAASRLSITSALAPAAIAASGLGGPAIALAAADEPAASPPPSVACPPSQSAGANSAPAPPTAAQPATAPADEPAPVSCPESGGTPAPGDPSSPSPPTPTSSTAQQPTHATPAFPHTHPPRHAKGPTGPRHRRHAAKRRRHRPRHPAPRRLSARAAARTGGVLWRPAPATLHTTAAASVGTSAFETSPPIEVPGGLSAQLSAPPAFLVRIYRQAGRRYHVPWRVLAAINAIETDYGRDLSVSPQGAVGWMQFMPATWHAYGAGGNPYDPHDAVFAAARLLHDSGASHDLRGAIFAYNHADWYVAAVLWRAHMLTPHAKIAGARRGYALPLDARYMHELGRTDDGVDIETAPDGAAVYSITPGVVVAIASDPAGFGPGYPVILATNGPLAGRYIYYGHVAASLAHRGQQVRAGQPIAIVGHAGDAANLGHGHIEIGFSDSSGNPLSHHGSDPWTPSGQVMRAVLSTLSARFGIAGSRLPARP